MAHVDFSDVKPGFKRQIHDSPWCTACPAQWYQKCDHNDIIPHTSMGTGWKNVGEKGCGNAGCKAICGKDFNETTQKHSCCLLVNGDQLNNCHPSWRSPSSGDCTQIITAEMRSLLASGKPLSEGYRGLNVWTLENPGKFEELKARECPSVGGSAPSNSICDIWCNTHPRECHQSRMNYCTQGDNIHTAKCQNWKDVATKQNFDISTYYNAEESWCSKDPTRMRSQQCVNWAMNPNMVKNSRSTKERYDGWFNTFCDQVHLYNDKKPSTWKPVDARDLEQATLQCSCTLKPGVNPNDRTTLDSNPYCFNGNCIARSEAYKTLRGFDDTRTCPNVCAAIINNNAGGTGIIRNVNIIQNCFNAQGQSDVRNTIRAAIEKELSKNILTLIRLFMATDQPLIMFKEFIEKEKPDLKEYQKAHEDLKFLDSKTSEYTDLSNNVTYQALHIVLKTLKTELLPEARMAYEKVITMEWPRTETPESLAKKYEALTHNLGSVLQGVHVTLTEYLGNTAKLIGLYNELVNERARVIREVKLKHLAISKDLSTVKSKIGRIEGDKAKEFINKAETIEDTIKKLDLSFLENITSNKYLLDREKGFILAISEISLTIVALDKEIEATIGGTLKEKAQRNKHAADKALNEFTVKYTRVSELAKNGKLSKRDSDLFVGYTTTKDQIINQHKNCLDIYSKPDFDEPALIALVTSREKLEAAAHSLGASLDAIQEYREAPREQPRKEPRKEPRDTPSKDNTFQYLLIGFIAIGLLAILWFLKKK